MYRKMIILAVAGATLLTGCGSSGSGRPQTTKKAAEPAVAPQLMRTPTGTVATVITRPQGIVYDARTRLVAVAVQRPARLLLLDPTTLAVRRTVDLPGTVRHLQLGHGGGSVLVPTESADELVQVQLPDGTSTVTKVGNSPHDAGQAANGDIVAGDEFGRSLSVIRDARVIKTFRDVRQPGGVIPDGTIVGIVDVGAYTVSTYDLTSLRRTARVAAGAGPTHGVLIPGDRFLVTDTRGGRVLIFSARPLRQVGSLALPGSPYGVATDPTGGLVWVTLTARNQVVGLDVRGTTPTIVARYPTVRQPDTVAVAPGSHELWVAGTHGTVERITR